MHQDQTKASIISVGLTLFLSLTLFTIFAIGPLPALAVDCSGVALDAECLPLDCSVDDPSETSGASCAGGEGTCRIREEDRSKVSPDYYCLPSEEEADAGECTSEGGACGDGGTCQRCDTGQFVCRTAAETDEAFTAACAAAVAAGEAGSKTATPTLKPRYLDNPLGTSSLAEIIARIISIFTGVSGSIALLMFVYGGILWLTSAGESSKVEAGRKAMVWAVIGLIIIFGSYAILLFLFNAIGASTLL